MDPQDIDIAHEKLKSKTISWVEFAEILKAALKEKIPFTIDVNKVRELIKAYHFISELGLVNNANVRATGYSIVVRLPFLRKVIEPEKYKLIMQDLLDGKLTDAKLTKAANEAYGVNPEKYANEYRKIKNLIRMLDKRQEDFEDMRKYLSMACDELTQRLQCICDETYYDLWKKREEFKI